MLGPSGHSVFWWLRKLCSRIVTTTRRWNCSRWDLVQRTPASSVTVVVAGGTDVARDAATSVRISLTGSGEVRPHKGKATGGGTFVHRHSNGNEVGHGVYVVTGF